MRILPLSRKNILSTLLPLISCVALSLSSINALSLGLGKLTIQSTLSEPLAAQIPIRLAASENLDEVHVKLASSNVYEKMGVEFGLDHIKVKLVVSHNADNQPVIAISTVSPFNSPFIELIVNVKTPSQQFNRSFTLLLDAPNNDNAPSVFK